MPTMTRTSRAVRVLAPLLLTAALAGCGLVTADPAALAGDPSPVVSSNTTQSQWVTPTPTSSASSPTPATAAETVDTGQAVTALAELPVKGRASKGGYSRDQFGQAWADTDRNGCDQRNDVLRRDLTDKVLKSDTGGCVVLTGMFADPYSGRDIAFERGSDSADVQIDHVVALMDAWQVRRSAVDPGPAHHVRERPAGPDGRRWPAQRAEGRLQCRILAAAEQGVPLRVRGTAGRDQEGVRPVGHPARARRHRAGAQVLPRPGAAHARPGRHPEARHFRPVRDAERPGPHDQGDHPGWW